MDILSLYANVFIMTPCSVKAYGGYFECRPLPFMVAYLRKVGFCATILEHKNHVLRASRSHPVCKVGVLKASLARKLTEMAPFFAHLTDNAYICQAVKWSCIGRK